MTRRRKIDEELWEDGEEEISANHVVERFFSRHEHDEIDSPRRGHVPGRQKRRPPPAPETEE